MQTHSIRRRLRVVLLLLIPVAILVAYCQGTEEYEFVQLRERCTSVGHYSGGRISVPGYLHIDLFRGHVPTPDPILRLLMVDGFQFVELESDESARKLFQGPEVSEEFKNKVKASKYLHFYRTKLGSEECKLMDAIALIAHNRTQCIGIRFLEHPIANIRTRWNFDSGRERPSRGAGIWGGRLEAVRMSDNQVVSDTWIGGYQSWHGSWGQGSSRAGIECWPKGNDPTYDNRLYGLLLAIPDPSLVKATVTNIDEPRDFSVSTSVTAEVLSTNEVSLPNNKSDSDWLPRALLTRGPIRIEGRTVHDAQTGSWGKRGSYLIIDRPGSTTRVLVKAFGNLYDNFSGVFDIDGTYVFFGTPWGKTSRIEDLAMFQYSTDGVPMVVRRFNMPEFSATDGGRFLVRNVEFSDRLISVTLNVMRPVEHDGRGSAKEYLVAVQR